MITSLCQRWNARRASWRPAGEVFDTRDHEARVARLCEYLPPGGWP